MEFVRVDRKTYQKMKFLYHVLQDGWKIKKKEDTYVLTKRHEGKKEYLSEDYLEHFLRVHLL
jgi:hypothetical protein